MVAASATANPRRGEVYLVNLDKARPALVLSVDPLNKYARDVCIIPITTKQHAQFSMRVSLQSGDGGLDRDCWAKCDQVTTVEKTFLQPKPLGMISPRKLAEIEKQVKVALGLLA